MMSKYPAIGDNWLKGKVVNSINCPYFDEIYDQNGNVILDEALTCLSLTIKAVSAKWLCLTAVLIRYILKVRILIIFATF